MSNEPIIVALSGNKGSGKNTLAFFISRYYTRHSAASDHFKSRGSAREVAFADGIKDFCIDILGLKHNQCYGSDEEKNTLTNYKWEDTPKLHTWEGMSYPEGYMTGREVMQVFGTECVRSWFGNVWAEATVRKIRKEGLGFALVTDTRFPNEVETILRQPEGYIVCLTRSPFQDSHPSETALDGFDWNRPKCFVLDNAQMTKEEQNNAVIPILKEIFSAGSW